MSDTSLPQGVPVATPLAAAPVLAVPAVATPVREQERILTLDVLRGVAVLGILLVNILYFAFTFSDSAKNAWRELPPLDAAARLFITFFAEFKFITIFSMLFGMGLALQSDRARQKGAPFGALYGRRLFVLLAIGLAHGVLLWYGDILSMYAILGFIALLCRNARPRTLLLVAVILFCAPFVTTGGCVAAFPDQQWTGPPDWQQLAEQQTDEHSVRFFRFMADEQRIYQSGEWSEMVLHRSAMYFFILPFATLAVVGWRCLGLFLLGMYMIRRGLFDDSEAHRGTYRKLAAFGLAVGLPSQIAAIAVDAVARGSNAGALVNQALIYIGSMGMSLGYVGLIALACLRRDWATRLAPVAAVGRMAASNYLAHSVLCGLIFYGYGLGLFGSIGHAAALLVVLAIYVAQLVVSPIWLRYFRFGPVEWLWRTLTYWKVQPLLRGASGGAAP